MIDTWIAGKMVDKLCARNLILRRINSVERDMMIADIQQTYAAYDQRILYEVFVDWIDQGHGIPQPADLIPRIKAIEKSNRKGSGLIALTPEQVTECRQICRSYGCNGRAFLDIVEVPDRLTEPKEPPMIRGDFQRFKAKLIRALEDGRIN